MKETIAKLRNALIPLYGKGESDAIIRLIFHFLKGWNLTDMIVHESDILSPYIKEEVDKILQRLLLFEPIQYITGTARFHGMNLIIRPGVLIPRPETDELVDIIIDENKHRDDLNVLDLCTGSGAIAIALAKNLPFSHVTAIDFSENAIKIATENIAKFKVKVNLLHADIFEWPESGNSSCGSESYDSSFDIIVSNPPYVKDSEALNMEKNVLNYEPHEALFVRDENPLVFYDRISDIAVKTLKRNGKLYLEANPLTVDDLKKLLISKGFDDIRILRDSFGKNRFVACVLNSQENASA